MTNTTTPVKPAKAKKDLSANTKFAITIGAHVFVGLVGVAATTVVTILLANAASAIEAQVE